MRVDPSWLAILLGLVSWTLLDTREPLRASDPLEDPPAKFVPRQATSASEQERLEAVSLFAAGRTEEQRGNLIAALRLYQRALRHDPEALPILRQVVDVAQQLDRIPEAMRYAQRAIELDPSDPRLVWSLADQFTEQNDFENALRLYKTAQAIPQPNANPALQLSLALQVGRLSFLTGRMKESAEAFAQVLDALEAPAKHGLNDEAVRALSGKDERHFELFGEAFLAAEQPKLAARAFEKAKQRAGDGPAYAGAYAFRQAQIQTLEKKYSAALESLERFFASKDRRYLQEPYPLLNQVLGALDKSEEFVPRLERLVKDDEGNVPLQLYLAKELRRTGQDERALAIYQQLHDSGQGGVLALRGLIELHRETKRFDPLLKLMADAVEQAGGIEPVARDAKDIASTPAELDALLAAGERLRKERPQGLGFGPHLLLGMMLLESERFDEAGPHFDGALATKPKTAAELVLTWGLGLLNGEQYSAAAAVFQRGLKDKLIPDENPIFRLYLALALEMDGRTDDALIVAKEAAAKAGHKNPRVESRVAWVLYHGKRYDAAEEAFRRLIAQFGKDFSNEDTRRVLREAKLSLSNICVMRNDLPAAEEWLEQVLDEFPDDISALNDLGYLWADQGKNLPRALEMVEKAVAAEPDNAAYLDSLGWALHRLGRHAEAREALKKAIAGEDDPDGVILDHLGDIEAALGNKSAATDAWRKALEKLRQDNDPAKVTAVEAKLKKLVESTDKPS